MDRTEWTTCSGLRTHVRRSGEIIRQACVRSGCRQMRGIIMLWAKETLNTENCRSTVFHVCKEKSFGMNLAVSPSILELAFSNLRLRILRDWDNQCLQAK